MLCLYKMCQSARVYTYCNAVKVRGIPSIFWVMLQCEDWFQKTHINTHIVRGLLCLSACPCHHQCGCWCKLNNLLITGITRHGDAPRRGRKPKRKLEAGTHQTTLVVGGVGGHTLLCQKPDGTVPQEAAVFASNALQLNKQYGASPEKTPGLAPGGLLPGYASKSLSATAAPKGEGSVGSQERSHFGDPSSGKSRFAWKSMVKSAPAPNVPQVKLEWLYHLITSISCLKLYHTALYFLLIQNL